MIRVKLSRPHEVVREGTRITLPAGAEALVSERQLQAFRDRMTPVAEVTPPAPPATGEGEPIVPPRTLVLVEGTGDSGDAPPLEPVPPAPEGEGEDDAPGEEEPEGEGDQPPAPPAGGEGEPTGFASPAAARHAAEAGVTLEDLRAAGEPSGQSGFTVADVAAVVAARAKA